MILFYLDMWDNKIRSAESSTVAVRSKDEVQSAQRHRGVCVDNKQGMKNMLEEAGRRKTNSLTTRAVVDRGMDLGWL